MTCIFAYLVKVKVLKAYAVTGRHRKSRRNNMGTNSTAATVKAVNILMKGGYRSGDTISYDDALGMLVEVIMKSTF